jgi:hypothetical protein
MKTITLSVCALSVLATTGLAQNNNPCPGAKEYQVNIIGVPKGKNPSMTGTNGHRIFVPLNGSTKIYMTGDTSPDTGLQCGSAFTVTDANGTDGSAELLVPCEPIAVGDPGVCFDVFATPLGTPGGNADVDVVCSFDDSVIGGELVQGSCATGTIDFSLTRNGGKPVQKDITNFMRASGCIDVNNDDVCNTGDIQFNNVWIFNVEQLLEYYWNYDNQGLRVAQLRFCEGTNCGSVTTVP